MSEDFPDDASSTMFAPGSVRIPTITLAGAVYLRVIQIKLRIPNSIIQLGVPRRRNAMKINAVANMIRL